MDTSNLTNTFNPDAETSELAPGSGSSIINVGNSERIMSTLGGAALTVMALRNVRSPGGLSMLLTGGFLLVRGISGYCAVSNALGRNTLQKPASPVEIEATVSVDKPRSDVYSFWRNLENLPRFMKHLETVEEITDKKSKWTAKGPGGLGSVSWEAEIVDDRANEFISWRSLPGSTVDNAGQVRFTETPENQTEIHVRMSYRLPAGDVGSIAAKIFSPVAENMMKNDILDLKSVMETPSAGGTQKSRKGKRSQEDKDAKNTIVDNK